ncbi:chemotaxis protein CheW [Sphingomonas profundi]|uniref:chemotaxis protein CheW n=1 Tax=Alterirhizorhabdus profundi TaxID=2681549 RepID=UPI0012E724ED|nr:chemotaxis protein CheW [Sphingomonas profundi]
MTLYLIATIAGQRVALAAAPIESAVEIAAITPVPRAPPHVAGLAALRSRVLTIVDCTCSLALGRHPAETRGRAVIVTVDAHQYGLLVDDVLDAVTITEPPRPAPLALAPGWAKATAGVVEHDGALLLLLDPAQLVDGPPERAAA